MNRAGHCFYCETGTHINGHKRKDCGTALCDCCRKPIPWHTVSFRGWCQHCELEFTVLKVSVRKMRRTRQRLKVVA